MQDPPGILVYPLTAPRLPQYSRDLAKPKKKTIKDHSFSPNILVCAHYTVITKVVNQSMHVSTLSKVLHTSYYYYSAMSIKDISN
jgi:hypothetical protein